MRGRLPQRDQRLQYRPDEPGIPQCPKFWLKSSPMSLDIDKDTVLKFDVPGPRYTSYPTAPVWSDEVGEEVYIRKLKDCGRSDKTLSLYVHIPFCRTMCSYCGCNVVIRGQ